MRLEKLRDEEYKQNDAYINGLSNYRLVMKQNLRVEESELIGHVDYNGDRTNVHFKYFPPGAVLLLKVALNESSLEQVKSVRNQLVDLIGCQIEVAQKMTTYKSEIEKILNELSHDELNILLYRCSPEETSEQINSDVYTLPAPVNSLVYAGLQGFVNVLERESLNNNLGHAIYDNLRQGNWMLDYTRTRLHKYAQMKPNSRPQLDRLANWLTRLFASLSALPRYLIPAYFDSIISYLYSKATDRCLALMSSSYNG